MYEHEEQGKTAKQIFSEARIPDWLNIGKYAKDYIKRWKKQKKENKVIKRGRPSIETNKPLNEMSIEELRKRMTYLELENEFLKKHDENHKLLDK